MGWPTRQQFPGRRQPGEWLPPDTPARRIVAARGGRGRGRAGLGQLRLGQGKAEPAVGGDGLHGPDTGQLGIPSDRLRHHRERPVADKDLAEDGAQGNLHPPLVAGATYLHRPLALEENLRPDDHRPIGHPHHKVVPDAAAALECVEGQAEMEQAVAAFDPQWLRGRKRDRHAIGQFVR